MIKTMANLVETLQNLIKSDNQEDSIELIKQEFSAFVQESEETSESIAVIEKELTCSVCFEMVLQACVTTCKHLFCKHCLEMSMLEKTECPLCRRDLSESSHRKLLPKVDEIAEIVMSRTNADYGSWAREEIMKRDAEYKDKKEKSETSENSAASENEDPEDGYFEDDYFEEEYYESEPSEENEYYSNLLHSNLSNIMVEVPSTASEVARLSAMVSDMGFDIWRLRQEARSFRF